MEQASFIGDDLLIDRLAEFFRQQSPDLDDILGAVCEVYCVDPSEIEQDSARVRVARRMYCYLSVRFARVPYIEIGARIGMCHSRVGDVSKTAVRNLDNPLVRDDLDLLGVRIAERVLLNKRYRRAVAA
jgi:chromosomal replication initiation ATPase DnaA